MAMEELGLGSRIKHPKYGEGVVRENQLDSIIIFFKDFGDREISKTFEDIEIIDKVMPPEGRLTLDEVEGALAGVLQKFADFTMLIPMGDRWRGGKMILQPANAELQGKEIAVENFFHKIVMVRDRLRVLEQHLNSHKALSDEEKVSLQQYITRIYGSLTTFNVLFAQKEDYFKGAGKE